MVNKTLVRGASVALPHTCAQPSNTLKVYRLKTYQMTVVVERIRLTCLVKVVVMRLWKAVKMKAKHGAFVRRDAQIMHT